MTSSLVELDNVSTDSTNGLLDTLIHLILPPDSDLFSNGREKPRKVGTSKSASWTKVELQLSHIPKEKAAFDMHEWRARHSCMHAYKNMQVHWSHAWRLNLLNRLGDSRTFPITLISQFDLLDLWILGWFGQRKISWVVMTLALLELSIIGTDTLK